MIDIILATITIVYLLIGSYTDFKKREVADWISYSLIAIALIFRIIDSLIQSSYIPILEGLAGLTIFLVISFILFYLGQWGGGDAKLLMGLGAVIGFDLNFIFNPSIYFPALITFLINVLIVGAVYGFIYSIILAMIKFKEFSKEYKKRIKETKKHNIILLSASILLIIISMMFADTSLKIIVAFIALFAYLNYHLIIFVKSIENIAMIKAIDPKDLTEGDWIVKDIKVDGKYICGPKDLGIEKKQINKLIRLKKQKKIKKILVKEGIPFIPSFLIAYIITIIFKNWFFLFI